MESITRKRPILTLIAVALSVVLFACGGRGDGAGEPVRQGVTTPAQEEAPARPDPSPPAPPAEEPSAATEEEPGAVEANPEEDADPAVEAPEDADDAEPVEPPRPPRARSAGPHVYTNEDLARYKIVNEQSGFRENAVVADLTESQDGGAPRELGDNKSKMPANEEEREKEILEVQDEMHSLSAELEYLKKRIPSLHNPFLPRAEISEDDQQAEAGLNNAERLDHVNERIQEAETRLKAVKLRYAELYKSKADTE